MADIAANIYIYRNKCGYTQKELADMLGVSNKSVSKWENAEAFPRDDTLDKLCSVLDINLDSDSDVNVEHERQLGELKRDNDGLKSELLYLKTKRRRAVTVTVIVSVLCLAVAAVIAFMISPDNSYLLVVKRKSKISGCRCGIEHAHAAADKNG